MNETKKTQAEREESIVRALRLAIYDGGPKHGLNYDAIYPKRRPDSIDITLDNHTYRIKVSEIK